LTSLNFVAGIVIAFIASITIKGLMATTGFVITRINGAFIFIIAVNKREVASTEGITIVLSASIVVITNDCGIFTTCCIIASVDGTGIVIITVDCSLDATFGRITSIRYTI